MAAETYVWAARDEFVNRNRELAALDAWWGSPERAPISLYGRRRAGKSWLFRRFAHGKPAVILVARTTAPGVQLEDFADRLEPVLGVRPHLHSPADLVRTLYRAARGQRLLAVIDEFPYLLPGSPADVDRELSAIAAVMEEERDESQLKLILCGSHVGQMESLLAEKGPLFGRLSPLHLLPVDFPHARAFLPELTPLEQFERFAISGGMPRYLTALAEAVPIADAVSTRLLNPNGMLWNEGRTIVEQELREPRTYFAILQALSEGDKDLAEVAAALRTDSQRASKYLRTLQEMRLIERRLPLGADPGTRAGHWHLGDPFLRFWFRFVFPFQDDLESGLPAATLYDTEVAPVLTEHISVAFEEHCRRWARGHFGVTRIGSWWGPARNDARRSGERTTEEIDIVGTARNQVRLVGEVRWRKAPTDLAYLRAVEEYKIPALRQSSLKVAVRPTILLISLGGFTTGLREAVRDRDDVVLVDAVEVLSDEPSAGQPAAISTNRE
jgi:hypothetical protein